MIGNLWYHIKHLYVINLTRGPQTSTASFKQPAIWCFVFQFLVYCRFLWSSSSCLLLLFLCLSVSAILPYNFSLTIHFRSQFLHKVWPILLVFLRSVLCRIFISSRIYLILPHLFTRSVQLILSIPLQHHIPQLSRHFWSSFRSAQNSAPFEAILQVWNLTTFFLKSKSNLLVKIFFSLLNISTMCVLLYDVCIVVLCVYCCFYFRCRTAGLKSVFATSTQVFLGFPMSISKCWDGSQDSKLPLHASHVALPT